MEAIDTFRKGKVDRLVWDKAERWDEGKGMKAGLQDDAHGYAREGVAFLMKDE